MTNYNESLDKLMPCDCKFLKGFAWRKGDACEGCINGRLKQAILRWVADEVIGEDEEETIEDKLGGKYRFNSNKRRRNIVRRNQRKILAQHGYKGDQR